MEKIFFFVIKFSKPQVAIKTCSWKVDWKVRSVVRKGAPETEMTTALRGFPSKGSSRTRGIFTQSEWGWSQCIKSHHTWTWGNGIQVSYSKCQATTESGTPEMSYLSLGENNWTRKGRSSLNIELSPSLNALKSSLLLNLLTGLYMLLYINTKNGT